MIDQKVLYEEMIEEAEKEIEIIKVRTLFWQREEIQAKSGKEGIMGMLREQAAQMILQTKWLAYLKEKAPK